MFAVNIPTTVAAWFRQRLGVAIGVQQSLGGMGASVMAPVLALVLGRTDWQSAFVGITIVGGIILFTLLSWFHNDPADNGMKPYGARATDQPQPSEKPSPAVSKIRTQVFLQHARRSGRELSTFQCDTHLSFCTEDSNCVKIALVIMDHRGQ